MRNMIRLENAKLELIDGIIEGMVVTENKIYSFDVAEWDASGNEPTKYEITVFENNNGAIGNEVDIIIAEATDVLKMFGFTSNKVKMNLQLLARKSVVDKATESGYKVENSIQANIVNNIEGLNKSSITISGNQKTGEIPCINLPNIQVQKDFIQVVKNNSQLLEIEAVKTLYNYMLCNPMCVNCGSCKDACYNNQAYRQYPSKAIADLRTLYKLISEPLETIGAIAQRTRNLRVVRLNGSGEIHNKMILDNYIKLAKLNPLTTYYTYTKNYKLLEGKRLPKNLIINVSQFGNMDINMSKYSKNTNVFKTVTQKEFDATIEDKKVKKCINDCSNCNYCYTKKGYTILVPIHGSDANKATL